MSEEEEETFVPPPLRHRDGNIEITTGLRIPIKSWTVGVEVEESAWRQLREVAALRFVFGLAVMPDVHWGKGATVGSVIATQGAVIPAAVGVDLGCGIMAVRTTMDKGMLKDMPALRKAIEAAIPFGLGQQWGSKQWSRMPTEVEIAWEGLKGRYRKIVEKHGKVSHKNPMAQLGSLGSGNHFIEVCIDEEEKVWFMLHSGSRAPGLNIANYFIRQAKTTMTQFGIQLPNKELAFLAEGTNDFDDYIEAVNWCQLFAATSRELMMDAMEKAIRRSKLVPKFERTDLEINCHHNFVRRETIARRNLLITRKGAVSARSGQLGIIPGSMGAKSFIVRGLGSTESFTSCSHGAGRRMSRKAAKQQFTLKAHRAATEGIECRKDSSVLDETPGAYKDIDTVMAAQKDLVEPIHTLRQVICVKGSDEKK